jgi:hypothetical protein
MSAPVYEVWVKPESGFCLVVQERDRDGADNWALKDTAIKLADRLHATYENMHFIVRECLGYHGPYNKVYDTSEVTAS